MSGSESALEQTEVGAPDTPHSTSTPSFQQGFFWTYSFGAFPYGSIGLKIWRLGLIEEMFKPILFLLRLDGVSFCFSCP
jgi:hypothetical protein